MSGSRPSPRVKVIPAKVRTDRNALNPDGKRKRVAAYARISTNEESQVGSYELQVAHYTDFIKSNPSWELVKVYADYGISGTSTKNRVEFQKLIQDCVVGKIDYIITKSISRFARNTLDCLRYIRELKALKIGIFFEKENIDTLDAKSELFLTILSSMAQEESRSISENTKWGVQKRFQRGIAHIPTTYFLGYDTDEEGNLVINEEQAAIVRRIYQEFLEGKGTATIAKGLMKDRILTARGRKTWTSDSVYKILTNEKFAGHALLQKTITVDFLTHKRIRNDGSERQYFIRNHHPAIISDEDWNAVQQEMKRRSKMLRDPDGKYAQVYSNVSYFSNILYCGECGSPVVRRRLTSERNGEKYLYTAWQCRVKIHPKKYDIQCCGRHVWESALEREFMDLLYEMKENREQVIKDATETIAEYDLSDLEKERLAVLDEKLETINERLVELTDNTDTSVGGVYEATIRHLYYEQEMLQAELDDLKEKQQESNHLAKKLTELLGYLDELDERTENQPFRADIFQQTVQRGIIYYSYEVTFEFKCGISRKVIATRVKEEE
ncbi:recombinase family protein [Schinkia azotoformans]|uniref:recombinase family protein n=1 Tax=Schinkia azotoformans TaxID=1454 RepID=UPI002DB9088F|nr:recombinase family protein [Schinkia azotoformans]MEC1771958.1 recombinase family protein [Schinkia azotoformans]MED4366456.1 recombinase family protein [Schinkia azotoformans]